MDKKFAEAIALGICKCRFILTSMVANKETTTNGAQFENLR
jgi:hypothetical protein